MTALLLPPRPRGIRKHWRKVSPELAECGRRLRELCPWATDMGDPVEAQEFWHRTSLKRIEARFADGRHVSLSRHASGHFVYRLRTLP